jgi:hypothetical protein
MERFGEWVVAGLGALMAFTHPHAAAGAAFGCCFFLAMPHTTNRRERMLLGIFSFGIGYAAGVFAYGGGPPFSEKAMFVAGSISALAVVIWTGLQRMAAGDGPLPQWLKDTLGFIPLFRRKGPDDGAE